MTPKDRIQQRLEELRKARRDLADAFDQTRQIKDDLSPKKVLLKAVRRHPWRWIAGGVAAGWIGLRMLSTGKARMRAKKTFTKGSVIGMIVGSLGALLRIPVEEFARRRLRDYLTGAMSGKASSGSAEMASTTPFAEPAPAASLPNKTNRSS